MATELKDIAEEIVFGLSPLEFSMRKYKGQWMITHSIRHYFSYFMDCRHTKGGTWSLKFKDAKLGTFEEMFEIAKGLVEFNKTCDVF